MSPPEQRVLWLPGNSHKFLPRTGVYVNRQDVPNTWRVELVLEKVGLQRGRFFRFQAMIERATVHSDDFVKTERLRKILCIVEREFLPIEIADRRMRFHNDPRFVAVNPRHECAVNGCDQAILQLMSIFTKVP